MTHWRKNLDPNWIGTYVLPEGKPITVEVDHVTFEKGLKVAGSKKDSYTAVFKSNPYFNKPMLLNPTNLRRLTVLTGTPDFERWVNVPVILCQEMSRMPDGSSDYALRISPQRPTKPELLQGSEAFDRGRAMLADGTVTIEQIRAKYNVSAAVEAALKGGQK